ncbi:hypothetical protein T492DRAFT_1097346 [Pavlovales sp. CCMP2436]|nr:hypothetical protein T492DRAFT_1097346 [Pavlovales sp. CCMP2436]
MEVIIINTNMMVGRSAALITALINMNTSKMVIKMNTNKMVIKMNTNFDSHPLLHQHSEGNYNSHTHHSPPFPSLSHD